MKKILVTGAGGFIGFNLCRFFAESGKDVIGLDLHYPDNTLARSEKGIEWMESDFRHSKILEKILPDVEFVVHLASAHLQVSLDKDHYWDVNVYSLVPLLELCRKHGVQRFIHVSSVGTYGKLNEIPADEDTECEPQSIYGETKLAGEKGRTGIL